MVRGQKTAKRIRPIAGRNPLPTPAHPIPPPPRASRHLRPGMHWVLAKGFNLSYHNKETILLTIDPYYGNLN